MFRGDNRIGLNVISYRDSGAARSHFRDSVHEAFHAADKSVTITRPKSDSRYGYVRRGPSDVLITPLHEIINAQVTCKDIRARVNRLDISWNEMYAINKSPALNPVNTISRRNYVCEAVLMFN